MNKTVVITGGSSGLGNRLAHLYLNDADRVCSLSRSDKDSSLKHYFCDVSDEKSVDGAINSVAAEFGNIDLLILCSGVGLAGSVEQTPADMVEKVFDVNFYGALYTVRAALKHMKKGSRIIAISSASAFFSLPYRSVYSASKSALNMVMFGLRMELYPDIEVSCVCPGEIDTDFVKNRLWHKSEKDEAVLNGIEQGLKKGQTHRISVQKVAEKIFAFSNKNKPKPVYIIGAKYKFFYVMSKILPTGLLLKITSKRFGGKK